MESVLEQEVYFSDESIFGDEGEHYYNVECFDGYGIATKCEGYDDDNAPAKLRVTYPKREEVVNDEEMAAEVLDYRGLDDITAEGITFGDIMMYYGELEVVES